MRSPGGGGDMPVVALALTLVTRVNSRRRQQRGDGDGDGNGNGNDNNGGDGDGNSDGNGSGGRRRNLGRLPAITLCGVKPPTSMLSVPSGNLPHDVLWKWNRSGYACKVARGKSNETR